MDLRHLRVFATLADELHFGRTAKRLRVAQSAVSQTLKALEEEVGVLLVARTKRRVALTAAGTAFLAHARIALTSAVEATNAARTSAAGDTGRLSLLFTTATALTFVPGVIARFRREAPKVHLEIGTASSVEQLERIKRRACDLGFVTLARDTGPLASEIVQKGPLIVLVSEQHRFARRRAIDFVEIADEDLVFLRPQAEPAAHRQFLRRCAAAGFTPNVVAEIDQVDTLLALVAAGIGIACVPVFVARLAFAGVLAVPLKQSMPGGVAVVWDEAALSAPAARFLTLLREERESLNESPRR